MPEAAVPYPSLQPAALPRLIGAVAARYAGASRHTRHYVGTKLRRDPATEAILTLAVELGGFGTVADLGCGRGQLALLLLLAGGADSVLGMDRNGPALAEAQAAAEGLPARFTAADLATAPLPDCDTLLLVDVLYQLPLAAQRALLDRMVAAARRRIVIRAFDPDLGWRSRCGFVMEWLNRAGRGDLRRAAIEPMKLPALRAVLEQAGFRVSITPCWGGMPLPNVLLLAEKGSA
ncbi:methyltransferase domain-containing protein [Pseudoroseomonas wenyumeiae]|uniref:Methyltransferase domain-containing protein n=1 Tax=Teichococcus wenyumeiae TaxID=2478470 RepID=A0A3A9JGT6_9PROT|nr:class I SAM-dependent methyltransferase [Pseudoroseomonas wenyumeiae]RKK05782.1 methyltransferase domain-containing protein [Pseudoroseomonas wenyumeiae]RMI24996.1 methyltransferase domain-containing protein [Pseudoroseomonas wenyumeiae]